MYVVSIIVFKLYTDKGFVATPSRNQVHSDTVTEVSYFHVFPRT